MKKIYLFIVLMMFIISNINAQKKSKLGFGLEADFTFGDINEREDIGYGLSSVYQHPLTSKLNLTGSLGISSIKINQPDGSKADAKYVPIKVGLKYYLTKKFFGSGELGSSLAVNKYGETGFLYSPGIGFEFPVSNKKSIELGFRYEAWSYSKHTNGFLGLKLAFNLGL
nr:hypothetical protein [Pedobacter sp. ASV2]